MPVKIALARSKENLSRQSVTMTADEVKLIRLLEPVLSEVQLPLTRSGSVSGGLRRAVWLLAVQSSHSARLSTEARVAVQQLIGDI